MLAVTIEIGPELRALLVPVAAAVAAWIGTRKVRKEMSANGGASMRDAVDRIEAAQVEQTAQLDAQTLQLDDASTQLTSAAEQLAKLNARVTVLEAPTTVHVALDPPAPPAG